MNIEQMRDIFPGQGSAPFNVAVLEHPHRNTRIFIGRKVPAPGLPGEPDMGILELVEVDEGNNVIHRKTLWEPGHGRVNLEDPRALTLADGTVIIGLTAVQPDQNGRPTPYPAIIKINSIGNWNQELPPFLTIGTYGPGKNLTPINENTYFLRPEGNEYHHKILAFSLHHQIPEKLADIEFPKNLSWAQWRIGTTMPPIWLSDTEALFIVHGITQKMIDGQKKYVYSLGRAKLTRTGNAFHVTVAPEPILTPDNFIGQDGQPLVPELHPELRRVVYACGGILKGDYLLLYVNVGDRTTYEVVYSMAELKQGLF